jgi:hypothetical protein
MPSRIISGSTSRTAEDPVGSRSLGGFIVLTDNDVDDIVAYLKLLGPNRIDK